MGELRKCDQENCTVQKDGVCLESIEELDQCPHFYLEEGEEDEEDDEETDDTSAATDSTVYKLFDGDELSLDRLTDVTYRFPASRIYILGEHDSGKTTLLATLFEMFQVGPFHGYFYAGSLTQIGFEKRCFYSRIASENGEADTERTKSEEFRFLHIALKQNVAQRKAKHFLISDISGEKIKRAKNNSEDMRDLQIVASATHVSFVIDGEKLLDPKIRQSTILQARTFIKKAIDEEVFNENTRLTLVVSKWDMVSKLEEFNFEALIERPFMASFEKHLKELTFLKVAIRPTTFKDGFKLGNGLPELLSLWDEPAVPFSKSTEPVVSDRMIDNFNFYPHD
jgi:hypothetical protein